MSADTTPPIEREPVLLVEDNPGDTDLIRAHLEDVREGRPELEVAETLAEALDLAAAGSFAAVLLDLNLPDSTGLDTLEALLHQVSDMPVIVLTGLTDEDMGVEALRRGAADFLPKGEVTGRLLMRSIRYAIERRKRHAAEGRFQALIENSRDLIVILDPDFSIRYVTPSLSRILGVDPEEMIGAASLEEVHRDDREEVAREATRVLEDPSYTAHLQYRVRHGDGSWKVLDTVAQNFLHHPSIRGLVVNSWDVTELEHAQADLRERVKELRLLYAATRELTRTSPPLERRLARVVELMPAGWLSPERTEARLVHGDHTFQTDGFRETPWMLHTRIQARNRTVGRLEVALTGKPSEDDDPFLDEEKELLETLGLALGEAIERQLLEREFVRAQKMEAVGRLSGGIAHDFNNLLTVIRAHCDFLLLELEATGAVADEVRQIRDAADQAAELTGQLLAFSREQVLRTRVLDLNEMVRSTRRLAARALGEDIRIELSLDDDLPAIRTDPGQLEQALLNLAVNARDAMPGGGTLTFRTSAEEVSAEQADNLSELEAGTYVRLEVTDTGVGMGSDTLARIFEPFFTTKSRNEGTGLGLAMVYGIVTQTGGAIHAESEPGRGSTFVLRFPATDEEPGPPEPPPIRSEPPQEVGGRILVVEDDDSVRRVTRMILERAGFEVEAYGSAELGLEALAADREDFDVVLTDLVMPGMGGRDLIERLRSERPELPLVAMSGYAEAAPGRRSDLSADVFFIRKPFTPDGLVERVTEAILRGR